MGSPNAALAADTLPTALASALAAPSTTSGYLGSGSARGKAASARGEICTKPAPIQEAQGLLHRGTIASQGNKRPRTQNAEPNTFDPQLTFGA